MVGVRGRGSDLGVGAVQTSPSLISTITVVSIMPDFNNKFFEFFPTLLVSVLLLSLTSMELSQLKEYDVKIS